MNMEEKNFNINKNATYQALADLGYPKDVRQSLSFQEVKEIIDSQMSYSTYIEKGDSSLKKDEEVKAVVETQVSSNVTRVISQELKDKFKKAYEDLGLQKEIIDLTSNPERNLLFAEVLRLGAHAKTKEEIDSFIGINVDILSDEEISFLLVKKETISL